MLEKRVIVCLDVREGRTTKGVRFKENIDVGDPVEMAALYYREGVDELVFYDITASAERRSIDIDVVRRVAEVIFIPFSVGGGIGSIDDMKQVLLAGAEKVSVNSLAVRNPGIIEEGASLFGSQCIVLGMDALRDEKTSSGYRVVIDGGRTPTELDALEWARRAVELGAGELLLTSMDADGHRAGYDIELTRAISEAVSVPVIASGGAGTLEDLYQALVAGKADAVLAASIFHYGAHTIKETKEYLAEKGMPIRM